MKIITNEIILESNGNCDIIDITDEAQSILNNSNLTEGTCCVFSIGSTASVTTIEYEPGLLKDIPKALEKLIPAFSKYHHNETWGDGNGHAHIRSALIGTSLSVPFKNGMLMLGTWQQIVLIDFDNRKRTRRVAIQLTGF
ncbi:MAG TPA: secondary thiamine-phosphate synthase enzyme YjbQ [Ignavibacteria bacterium]|nr:secondary thiamine-phosphate synthase enzyme YjbQ [Ignavibacteria bacterium]HRJ99100.1 secondary thiamine-phosphate synthase enzyme YjbQ [Ignavibacteria bacterium]